MQSSSPNRVRGWLFDVYPSVFGEMTVWIIAENGQRVRLTDKFQPQIYVSGKQKDIERLASRFYTNQNVASWSWAYKYANPTDHEKSRVLEITLTDCRRIRAFTNEILKLGDYLRYEVHNCDLHGDRAYLFEHDLFPLAFLEATSDKLCVKYRLIDDVKRFNYSVPLLRVMKLDLKIAKAGKIARFNGTIDSFQVTQAGQTVTLNSGKEEDKLLDLVGIVKELDPDIVLTNGGDSHLFSYLIQRANANGILDKLVLSRDNTPFVPKPSVGRTFFSYGRVFYKAPTTRLFGRIHIDTTNTFILNESSFQGLFEIARLCRVPLHTASRGSIGSSMSSLQFYQAFKDDILCLAATVYPSFTPLLVFAIVLIIAAVVVIANLRSKPSVKSHFKTSEPARYAGQFDKQMELDMRLPYRRFKQLYPNNQWTYEEYKKMQTRAAFRRSTSSQENKRMVR